MARASGRPWVSVALSPVSMFSATDPPVFSGMPFEERLAGLGPDSQRVILRAGRPMPVVPNSQDQPDHARRLRRLGVARSIPAERYDDRRAARAIA